MLVISGDDADTNLYQNLLGSYLKQYHHVYHGFCGHSGDLKLSANVNGPFLPSELKSSKSDKNLLVCVPCLTLYYAFS